MIGVTIGIGSVWLDCAREAARRMQHYTGLSCEVVSNWLPEIPEVSQDINPSWLKLWLQERLYPGEDLLIFDADLFCRKPWNPAALLGKHDFAWVLVKPFHTQGVFSFPALERECLECGLDLERYGNCGLMLVKADCKVLEETRVFYPSYGSWLEQTGVNRIVQNHPELDIALLPPSYNWSIPSRVWLHDVKQIRRADPVNLHLTRMRGEAKWFAFARRFLLADSEPACLA